jgi:hypothetical protein
MANRKSSFSNETFKLSEAIQGVLNGKRLRCTFVMTYCIVSRDISKAIQSGNALAEKHFIRVERHGLSEFQKQRFHSGQLVMGILVANRKHYG